MNTIQKPSPLGRGLSALFGDVDASYAPQKTVPVAAVPDASIKDLINSKGKTLINMPVTFMMPGKYQPRRHFDDVALAELAQSIKERGILEPLIVRPAPEQKGDSSFEIIAGERRWRAAQMAGLHEVPVVVRNMDDREALEFSIIENVQRSDLSPIEEAEGYNRLIQEFDYTQEKLASIMGKSRPHITNMLRLLGLPQNVRLMLAGGQISAGHARALVTTRDPEALAKLVVKKNLTVRQTEDLAKTDLEKPATARKKKEKPTINADVAALEQELQRVIGLRVKIVTQGKAGTLTLHYNDLDQLDDIIQKLRG